MKFFVATMAAFAKADPWDALKTQLDGWMLTENFAVTVGNSSGRVFEYTHGEMTLHTKVGTASTSKWPMAMAMAGLVNDGTIKSLDDPIHQYIDWWTADPKDNRSYVTLNHLLSFTSGFGGGAPGVQEERDEGSCLGNSGMDIADCAKELYSTTKLSGKPGTVFAYNSVHLQLAGGIACLLTKQSIQQVLDKYLFKAFGMVETECPGTNPELAICLNTTGSDYEQFLSGLLSRKVLSRPIMDQSERDHTPFLGNDSYSLYGHYAYGHFLECFDSADGFTEACREAQRHIDPGAFGYFPMIDRKYGFYMQIVAYENGPKFYPRSGIPEYLAQLIQPIVTGIITGVDRIEEYIPRHAPLINALSIADVNYIVKCYADPLKCL